MPLSRQLLGFVRRRADPRAVATARVGVGAAFLLKGVFLALELPALVGPGFAALPRWQIPPPPGPASVPVLGAVWIAASALVCMGRLARPAAAAVSALAAWLLASDLRFYSNHLVLIALLALLLATSRCDAALVAGRAQRDASEADIPAWPAELLKVQISIVYLFAGLSKLNSSFLAGEPLLQELRREPLRGLDQAAARPLVVALALGVVLLEIFLALALWSRRLRGTAFVLGLALHVGILVWLGPDLELLLFGVCSLSLYVLFLEVPRHGVEVRLPGAVARRWLQRLDWLAGLRVVRAKDPDARVAVLRDGRRLRGLQAAQAVLRVLPLSFLFAPLLGRRAKDPAADARSARGSAA